MHLTRMCANRARRVCQRTQTFTRCLSIFDPTRWAIATLSAAILVDAVAFAVASAIVDFTLVVV